MAECLALSCPRLSNPDSDNRALSITVPSAQVTRDTSGNVWCNYCQHARALMGYGYVNNWPVFRAQGRCLIPAGYADWYLSIVCGDRTLLDTFSAELLDNEESEN